MSHADVAVIIPVYNQAELVLGALDSVARQTLLPRRLVVVDDGSTDGTANAVFNWLQSKRPAFDTLVLRQPRNGGQPAAVNRGLAMVRDCQYLALFDSDDIWPADFVERAYGALAAQPKAVAATCDQLHAFDDSEATDLFDASGIEPNAACWLFADGKGIGSATLLLTQHILELGGLNERLRTGHDLELFLSLSMRGRWLHVRGRPVVFRRPPKDRRGEPTHLSEKYADNQRRWAQIYDDFIEHKGGRRVVPRRLYSRTLANRWNRAGHQLLQSGHAAEARRCLLRSIRWRPWRMSVWRELLEAFAASKAATVNVECLRTNV